MLCLADDVGLEFVAEEKTCWAAVVMEIVSGVAGGSEGNVATTRA